MKQSKNTLEIVNAGKMLRQKKNMSVMRASVQ